MVKRIRRYNTSSQVDLVLTGAIAVGYCVKLFTGTKQVMLADTLAQAHPPKKHKLKHKVKNNAAKMAAAPLVDAFVRTDRVVATKPGSVKRLAPVVKLAPVKQLPDSVIKMDLLYTTYIQPNITSIVKLRNDDEFYADIIADIPANSEGKVLKKGPVYYQVAYNNNAGFVPKWSLQTK